MKSLEVLKKISKRQRFLITAILLAAGLLAIQTLNISFSWRYQAIGVLAIVSYLLSAWSLSEGLVGIQWFTVLVLPAFYTLGVGLFYFLIPVVWWTGLLIAGIYGVGIYVLFLTENIFSVAAIRTIQLLRSAQAVGFLLTIVTAFFLYDTIFSFRLDPWFNFLLVSLVSLPLLLQGLWHINLEEYLNRQIWFYGLTSALVLGEMALAFSFWPITVAVSSLALTTAVYIVLGLIQHQLNERLFKKTINEYVGVGAVVLIIIFLTTHWGG